MNYINRFFGGLVNLLTTLPFIVLSMAFIPFLFIDRLVQGRIKDAFFELLTAPFKMMLVLISQVSMSFTNGWELGFLNFMKTSPTRLMNFFSYEINVNSDYLFSTVVGLDPYINHFEGPFFGFIIKKFLSFTLPYKYFENYNAHDENPHNPVQAHEKNVVYSRLQTLYKPLIEGNEQELCTEIDSFIDALIDECSTEDEKAIIQIAKRCLVNLKQTNAASARDLEANPTPLNVLFTVWTAIKEESQNPAAHQKALVSYLVQMQHGSNPIETASEAHENNDVPECPTGAVGLLLDALKILDNPEYAIAPMPEDSFVKMRHLLEAKLNQNYNLVSSMVPNWARELNAPEIQVNTESFIVNKFKESQKRPMHAYAEFLQNTPQGNQLFSDKIEPEALEATIEETIEAWGPV